MFIFTRAITSLTISNLLWFRDLTFQVPMQYCYLQHWTLLPSPVTSTTGYCFCFGSISSFYLELFLHSSPVAYWASIYLGSSSFSFLSFCLFILFMELSRQENWSDLPFPSPVDHILSELSTMNVFIPTWRNEFLNVALHGMAHSFLELGKVVVHEISLISFLWFHFFCGFILSAFWGIRTSPDSSVGIESTCNTGDPSWIPGSVRSPGERIGYQLHYSWALFVAQRVNNTPTMQETWVRSLGWEDLEKGNATHSIILA